MTVSHAVELELDGAAAAQVRRLLSALADAGITPITTATPHVHPHVSVAVVADAAPERIASVLDGLGHVRPDLALSSVGAFPGPEPVVFLGVTPSPALLALNADVHARLDADGLAAWPLYRPTVWVPHCTLAMRVAALGAAVEVLGGASLPIAVRPAALRVVEVPTGKVRATVG